MTGTITITIKEPLRIEMDMQIRDVSKVDKLLLVDSLLGALEMDEVEREVLGVTIIKGGVKSIPGIDRTEMRMPKDVMDLFR